MITLESNSFSGTRHDVGVDFVKKHIGAIVAEPVVILNRQGKDGVGDKDYFVPSLDYDEADRPCITLKGIEVKTCLQKNCLTKARYKVPTIPFELFSVDNSRKRKSLLPGWLFQIVDPELAHIMRGDDEPDVALPSHIVFLQYEGDTVTEESEPFAIITLSRVEDLIATIADLAYKQFDDELDIFDATCHDTDDTEWWRKHGVEGNVWNVPIDRFGDYVTVTMLSKPELEDDRERMKYEYLVKYAKGKHLNIVLLNPKLDYSVLYD